MSTPYPPSWEADVVAADGGTVHLRPIMPTDAAALIEFHNGLSVRTRYLRFFSAYPRMPERDVIRFTTVDHRDRVALVALLADKIIAVGRYERTPGTDEAEVAFVVADAHQGRGIGSVLLEHLAAAARERGIRRFTAVVLAENDAMLRVFRDAGYQASRHVEYGEVSLDFEIDETALTESVMREREQRAEARSIRRLLFPTSVAVVGASADETKIGHAVLQALLDGDFAGDVFAVNHSADEVDGVPTYPTVSAIPQTVDLAVLAVPAASVPGVVAECAAVGVHGLVVVSGGFGERGDAAERQAGLLAQRTIVTEARAHGLRVVGPNCLGIINTDPSVRLNASLAPITPPSGRAGFFSQSGALGVAILGEAARRGLGVSTFVSAGNRADVSGNDLLQYWETDPATDIALLYLESFGNPRKFARLARRMGRSKPIVAVKSGRNSVVAGLAETSVTVPDASVRALFESSGVIRVDTVGDLFDVAALLAAQPLPAGDRVAIVGNSGALAVLAAEACDAERLAVAALVDLGVDCTPEEFGAGIAASIADPEVDAVVAVYVPPLQRTSGAGYAQALRAAGANGAKTVLSTFLGFDGVPTELAVPGPSAPMPGSVPAYPTPERAVRALALAVRHAQWRNRPVGVVPPRSVDSIGAREFVDALLGSAPARVLSVEESLALLGFYGIDVVPARVVHGLTEALDAAARFTDPVALKVPGAVRVHLVDPAAVREAWASLELADDAEATVQVMAPRGVDVVLEIQADSSFGSLVSFSIGGVATELLGDRGYAAVPLTDLDAADLLMTPRAAPMLIGYGDAQPANLDSLAALVLKLSALADELPEVAVCSLWGVAAPGGTHVLATEIELARPGDRSDIGPRRLRGL